jgi:putative nucleotidyltransferase with HDIG domain
VRFKFPLVASTFTKNPGTFQHSLQVANLAEEACYKIGGNALLVRTGAMYHDIGKMSNPRFFTENQVGEVSPHEDLSAEESAQIIIGHVIKGVEIAKENKLPETVIDFIRTHHGTTTTRFFYITTKKSMKEKLSTKIYLDILVQFLLVKKQPF